MFDSYYGSYRTRTFAEIFPTFNDFSQEYNNTALKINFTTEGDGLTLEQFYYMMYAHYGNSHVAYSDENQFKYYMFSIMYQYGPTVIRKREIRETLLKLSDDQLIEGGKAIYNHSFNPNTAPSTSTLEELLTINDQNTTNYKKSKAQGLVAFLETIGNDPVDSFIHKFKQLFLSVVAPDYPLLYETEVE
mgnify:CR=1 FL=1